MTRQDGIRHRTRQRDLAFGKLAMAVAIGIVVAGGCRSDGQKPGDGGSGGDDDGGGDAPSAVQGLDLLFVVDNSRSMRDKQDVLRATVPRLVSWLVSPPCLDDDGEVVKQPDSPDADCPAGSRRPFEPVTDLNVGVISSSLGGHGSDACTAEEEPMENDRGRLLDRGASGYVATYDDLGFLAWAPRDEATPPGPDDAETLAERLGDLVLGTGQLGCGFESTHESWYRFLIDPDPHAEIEVEDGTAILKGTDDVVLWQRASFLRPDTALGIVVLSDENDCSIRQGGRSHFAAQIFGDNGQLFHLPKPRAACATDPGDPCCRSCGQAPGQGCDDSQDDCEGALSTLEDSVNLRCFDQKRRFGIDFLHPLDRYVAALSELQVTDREGNVRPNPLFVDADPLDDRPAARSPDHVRLTTIVGVPWQDIARASGGEPSASAGLQSAQELESEGTWDVILGDPSAYHTDADALPSDPLMRESIDPRTGNHPVTGESLAPPGSLPTANSINGHEVAYPQRDGLQYACIFELAEPRDCSDPNTPDCACDDGAESTPLCQQSDGSESQTQLRAAAYPGIRHLRLVRALGDRGVIGSICPAQLQDPGADDYGYWPAARSLLDSLAPLLSNGDEVESSSD